MEREPTKEELADEIGDVVPGFDPQVYDMSIYFDRGDLRALTEYIIENDPEAA